MDNKDDINQIDSIYEKIDFEELADLELNEEEKHILDALNLQEGFQVAVEEILSKIDSLSLPEIQSHLLLLMRGVFRSQIKDRETFKAFMKKKSNSLGSHLKSLSLFIMNTHSKAVRDANRGISIAKDKYQYINQESRRKLRETIKKFALYEIYKFMNPRRIAGETRKENFINNMVVGGLERAKNYEGGTKQELKSYTPKFINELEKQHKIFSKKGMKKGGARGLFM
jgi:hypothetical protein